MGLLPEIQVGYTTRIPPIHTYLLQKRITSTCIKGLPIKFICVAPLLTSKIFHETFFSTTFKKCLPHIIENFHYCF